MHLSFSGKEKTGGKKGNEKPSEGDGCTLKSGD